MHVHSSLIPTLTGRVGSRHYIKLSTNYESTLDGACTNDKYSWIGDYLSGWKAGFNSSNGGAFSPTVLAAQIKGKWVRIEQYLDTYANPTTQTFYIKNLTDGTPERSFSVPARLAKLPNALPSSTFALHHYREGTCAGDSTIMYAIVAHWPTNEGQRIAPAVELEGAALPTQPPQAPSGTTVK